MIRKKAIVRVPVRPILWLVAGSLAVIPPAAASDSVLEREVVQGDRLEVRNYRGSIRIVAWDRDQLRVEAEHPSDEEILLDRRGSRWLLVPASWQRDSAAFEIRLPDVARVRVVGQEPHRVDFVISMPAHMAVVAESPHGQILVEGAVGPVDLTSMLGDLTVTGGAGPTRIRSMTGRIEIRRTGGRTTIEGASGQVLAGESSGELRIETTWGDVLLEELEIADLDVTTLNGDIELQGPLTPGGRYDLSTHGGNVELSLAGTVDAQFAVRALRGSFETGLPIDPPPEKNRADFALGDGSARVRLESFSGRISIDRAAPDP